MTVRAMLVLGLAALSALSAPVLSVFAGREQPTSVVPCSARVHSGALPVWMRAGFSPNTRITYEVGQRGAIGAVLWNKPLNAPPSQSMNNKILWVPRHYAKTVAPLWIKMQKMTGTQLIGAPVRRIIKTGPGPSLVDAPSAGCWRLTLSWSGQKDTLDLQYVPPTD